MEFFVQVTTPHIALRVAIENNDMAQVQTLLQQGHDPNLAVDHMGHTVLNLAIQCGHEALVTLLLESGAVVNDTAVCKSVRSGSPSMLRQLLQRGGNPNATLSRETTVLMLLALSDDKMSTGTIIEFMDVLVQFGVDLDRPNVTGFTAMSLAAGMACRAHAKPIVKHLLDSGAHPLVGGKNKVTPFHAAIYAGYDEVLTMLIERVADFGWRNEDGQSLLHIAVELGNHEFMERLLVHRVNLSEAHAAAHPGSPLPSELLLDQRNGLDETPLHTAAQLGHANIASLLLDAGADIDAREAVKSTPLVEAMAYGNTDLVELLKESGADQEIPNEFEFEASTNGEDGKTTYKLIRYD